MHLHNSVPIGTSYPDATISPVICVGPSYDESNNIRHTAKCPDLLMPMTDLQKGQTIAMNKYLIALLGTQTHERERES